MILTAFTMNLDLLLKYLKKQKKFKSIRNRMIHKKLCFSIVIIASMILASCSTMEKKQSQVKIEITPTESITQSKIEISPSPEPTMTPTSIPTGIPELRLEAGGELTTEQSVHYQEIEKKFKKFWDYVSLSPKSTLENGSWQVLIAHVMFDIKDPDSFGVAYEDPKNAGNLMTFPWGPDGQVLIPPEEYSEDGKPLVDLLILSKEGILSSGENYILHWQSGRWIRVADNGNVIEAINDKGEWERVKREVILSLDPYSPTKLAWEEIFGDNKSVELIAGDGFVFEGLGTWDKFDDVMGFSWDGEGILPLIEDKSNNFVTIYPLANQIYEENIHVDGYISTISPEGEEVFLFVQSMRGIDGNVVQIKMAVSENDPDVQRVFDNWFSGRYTLYFIPIARTISLEDGGFCPGLASQEVCELSNVKGDFFIREFAQTGNFVDEMSEGFFIPEPMSPY